MWVQLTHGNEAALARSEDLDLSKSTEKRIRALESGLDFAKRLQHSPTLFWECQSLQATIRKQGRVSRIPQGNKQWKGRKNGRAINVFFCYHILVRETSPIFHIKNVHLSVTTYMQQSRLIFLPGNFICYVCELNITALTQAKLAATPPLLPAQEMAGSKSNTRHQSWLCTALRILWSSVTLFFIAFLRYRCKSPGFPFKEATPQHPWRLPWFCWQN